MTKIYSKEFKDTVIFYIQGELNKDEKVEELKTRINNYISKGKKKFVINLKEVTTISSTGLSILIGLLSLTSSANCKLILTELSEPVQKIIETTKLTSIFDIQDELIEKE